MSAFACPHCRKIIESAEKCPVCGHVFSAQELEILIIKGKRDGCAGLALLALFLLSAFLILAGDKGVADIFGSIILAVIITTPIFIILYVFFKFKIRSKLKQLNKSTMPAQPLVQPISNESPEKEPTDFDLMQKAIEDDDWDEFDRLSLEVNKNHAKLTAEINALLCEAGESVLTAHDLEWGDSSIHDQPNQIIRQKRAHGCYLKRVNEKEKTAQFVGSGGIIYNTELSYCTCPDFERRGLPCKHMYRLADELGLMALPEFEEGETDYTLI